MSVTIDLIRDLVHVGTWMIQHVEDGLCPDPVEEPARRDPDCPACKVLIQADAVIAANDRNKPAQDPTR